MSLARRLSLLQSAARLRTWIDLYDLLQRSFPNAEEEARISKCIRVDCLKVRLERKRRLSKRIPVASPRKQAESG
jgi:hypothetical protein